jgi:hypothetical protein
MFSIRARFVPLILAAAVLAPPSPAAAQDVEYETVTRAELPGVAGTALRIASRLAGQGSETVERTLIQGQRMRVDGDGSSTITDLENRRVIMLDHKARTYTTVTFAEAVALARQAGAEAGGAVEQRREAAADEAEVRFDFRFDVVDGRQRDRVAGYAADRFFVTLQADGSFVPEDQTEMQEGGSLVVLTDLWTSADIPAFAARGRFDEVAAAEMVSASAALTEGLAAALTGEPQLAVAFEKSMQEARKIQGMPVRTATHFVILAPGHDFDRELATGDRQQEGPGLAAQAARAGLGRLARRAAGVRGGDAAAEPEAGEAKERTQLTLMTVTTEIRNVRTTRLDPALFEPPAGYREVRLGER